MTSRTARATATRTATPSSWPSRSSRSPDPRTPLALSVDRYPCHSGGTDPRSCATALSRTDLAGQRAQGRAERSVQGGGGVRITAGGSLIHDHDGPLQGGRVPDVSESGHHGQRGTEDDERTGSFYQRIAGFCPRLRDVLAEEDHVRLEHALARGTADDLEGLGRLDREPGVPVRMDHGRRLGVPAGIGGREPPVEFG